jgi:hypothetical protein
MVNSEVRRENLLYLWRGTDTLQKHFAAQIKTSPNTLNQFLTGHRVIGSRTARKVEQELSLPLGWMDERHEKEWELGSIRHRNRQHHSRALSRVGASLASRIEALGDDLLIGEVSATIERLERRKAKARDS